MIFVYTGSLLSCLIFANHGLAAFTTALHDVFGNTNGYASIMPLIFSTLIELSTLCFLKFRMYHHFLLHLLIHRATCASKGKEATVRQPLFTKSKTHSSTLLTVTKTKKHSNMDSLADQMLAYHDTRADIANATGYQDLPGELRNDVYKYLIFSTPLSTRIVRAHAIPSPMESILSIDTAKASTETRQTTHAMRLVNKQYSTEYLDIVYNHLALDIDYTTLNAGSSHCIGVSRVPRFVCDRIPKMYVHMRSDKNLKESFALMRGQLEKMLVLSELDIRIDIMAHDLNPGCYGSRVVSISSYAWYHDLELSKLSDCTAANSCFATSDRHLNRISIREDFSEGREAVWRVDRSWQVRSMEPLWARKRISVLERQLYQARIRNVS